MILRGRNGQAGRGQAGHGCGVVPYGFFDVGKFSNTESNITNICRLLRALVDVITYGLCVAFMSMNRCLRPIVCLRAAGRSSRQAAGNSAAGLACVGPSCSTSRPPAGRRSSSWSGHAGIGAAKPEI